MTQTTMEIPERMEPPAHGCDLHVLAESVSADPNNAARLLVAEIISMGGHAKPVLRATVVAHVYDTMKSRNIPLKDAHTLDRHMGDCNGRYCEKNSVPVQCLKHGWTLVHYTHKDGPVPKGFCQLLTTNEFRAMKAA
jgi:hypothetical protein